MSGVYWKPNLRNSICELYDYNVFTSRAIHVIEESVNFVSIRKAMEMCWAEH